MIDTKAFHSLSYGLYIICSREESGRAVGCIANTFCQVTSSPAQVSVALNKENHTCEVIRETGRFSASVLDQSATMELIGTFGFHSSADIDKFKDVQTSESEIGVPFVTQSACALFSAQVVDTIDLGSHLLFIGKVEESRVLEESTSPMTYAYYHSVKGGKTPPKASSFDPDDNDAAVAAAKPAESTSETDSSTTLYAWRCTICGHIEYVDELPDDYVCPVCGVGKDLFERIEVK